MNTPPNVPERHMNGGFLAAHHVPEARPRVTSWTPRQVDSPERARVDRFPGYRSRRWPEHQDQAQ